MIKIWSNIHCAFAANHLVDQLKKLGHEAMVIDEWDSKDESLHILYQVSNKWNLPKNYILMQTEPWMSHWFNDEYRKTIKNALAVWDYAEVNQGHYDHKNKSIVTPGVCVKTRIYSNSIPKTLESLFYGWIEGSERRKRIINELIESHNITVVTDMCGPEMWEALLRTKLVFNVHYHENSPLELYRIGEAQSHGCLVVTEKDGGKRFEPVTIGNNLQELREALKQAGI